MTIAEHGANMPHGLVVRDAGMLTILRRIERVATSDAPVLITGESGTGKNLVAAHLHRCSGVSSGPFVVLNCAAISETMLDAELFGHDKAACGGGCHHSGKFEAARGGTLLLDGIGELDLHTQAKVLRAICQHEADSAGPSTLGVRVVASTNRIMDEEVRHGRFRADLFFRLNVVAVKLLPLRERSADIPALADHFSRRFAAENGFSAAGISPAALDLLLQHTWPGNVRELANVMYRAVLTSAGGHIIPSTLEIDQGPAVAERFIGPAPDDCVATVNTSGRTIEAVEKDMILDALRRCRGNRGQTAVVLGISIRTLRNKLNEYERNGTRIPRPVVIAVA